MSPDVGDRVFEYHGVDGCGGRCAVGLIVEIGFSEYWNLKIAKILYPDGTISETRHSHLIPA